MKRLTNGTELKLEMTDGTYRVVQVLRVRQGYMAVQERFHGQYKLPYEEIRFVHEGLDGKNLCTRGELMKAVDAQLGHIRSAIGCIPGEDIPKRRGILDRMVSALMPA